MPARKKRAALKNGLTPKRVRELALSLPDTQEGSHMSHPDFRVRNKIFAALNAEESQVNVKIDPTNLDALVRSNPSLYRDVWAGRWVGIEIARADAAVLEGLLEDAWLLTAPKALVKALRADREVGSRK